MQVITPAEIGKYLNQARTNPQSILPFLQKQLASFKNSNQIQLRPHFFYNTNQGKSVWLQTIAFIKAQKPLPPLALHQGLRKAAHDHANDLASNNMMGHTGSDGSSMSDRIQRYCNYNNGTIGQNVAQQFTDQGRNHALESILSLIIDDGVSNRGHRKSIFSSDYHFYGSASIKSSEYIITVIDYSSHNLPDGKGSNQKQSNTNYGQNIYQMPKQNHKEPQFNINSNFGNFENDDINFGVMPKNSGSGGSGRYVVSTSTKTQSKTVNGKKTTKTITQKKYNDGSVETEEHITTNY